MKLPRPSRPRNRINFEAIKASSLRALPDLLNRWLPGGKMIGTEYCVLNPKRGDRNVGNFKVNMRTGHWADFAAGGNAKGGDVISLAAYLFDLRQIEAAKKLASMFGIDVGDASGG